MSFAVRSFMGKVKGEEWMGKTFIAFDTENPEKMEKREWSAAEKIVERLRDRKMSQLLPVLRAAVQGQKGSLLEGEIERTREYAREIAGKLKENPSMMNRVIFETGEMV